MYFVVFVGPAGSGKSHLVDSMGDWLAANELTAIRVNLDPAAEWLPYDPDVDVRRYVRTRDLMIENRLGPNGALVASIDQLAFHVEELRDEISSFHANYVLVDTPGQMELFAFRETGPLVLKELLRDHRAVAVFLVDAVFASKPASLASSLFLAASTRLRLQLPQVLVVSKADLLGEDAMGEIEDAINEPYKLYSRLVEAGVDPEFADSVSRAMEALVPSGGPSAATVFVSSISMYGLDHLYAVLQQVLAGGEDYLTEEPNPHL